MGHNKQSRFITTRIPQTESEMQFQGMSRVEQGAACQKAVICRQCDLRQAPSRPWASLTSCVEGGGSGDADHVSLSGDGVKGNKM